MLLWILVDAANFNPQGPVEDDIISARSANGNYSAKSAYKMQFDGSLESSFQSGRQTACSSGSGRTSISALFVLGIWKL
jgi:hypothetical protein